MRRSASEIIRNLEMRIARLEKQSRRNEVEVDEDGELVDVEAVIELIDLEDVAYEILNDGEFEDMMEEQGEDIDDLSPRLLTYELEVESTSAGRPAKRGDHFFFFVECSEYDFAAIVSVDLQGEPSVDHIGEYDSAWKLFNRWARG